MDGFPVPGHIAQGAVELELQYMGQEITGVRRIEGDVILCTRIERVRRPFIGCADALVLLPQLPPQVVVTLGPDFSGKHFPAPLVDQQAKWQKCNF